VSKVATQVYTLGSYENHEASDLPEGWVQATIGTVADLNPPKPPPDALPLDAPVTFVPMPAVDAYSGTITVPTDRPFGVVRKGYTSFRDNDVIFAKITPCMENGKAAIVRNLTNGLGFGSTEFHVLRSTGAVIPEYLFYYVRQESFRQAAEANMTGSVGQKRVPVEFIKNAQLPVPPLSEQKRIVAKVEELLARVNAVRERLAKVPAILKRFRQAVLAAACSGRLTADWREKNPDVEPVTQLLEQIEEARKIKGLKKEKVLLSESGELPPSWVKAQLSFFIESMTNGIYKPAKFYSSDGVVCLRMYNIQDGQVIWKNLKRMNLTSQEIDKYILKTGDILINRVNSRELVGKAAIIRELKESVIFESKNIRLRLIEKDIMPKFVNYCFMTRMVRDVFEADAKQTVGMATISQPQISHLSLPVPPISEQQEIVRRVEALFKLADVIEKRVAAATVRAERLTQSILAKAFRGELVPTEAELSRSEGRSYEPASTLLAKIEAQRKDMKPKPKHRQFRQWRNK